MTAPVFELRVRVPLDRFALEVDVVSERRVLGLFGPSGAGKTTFLEAVAGLRRGATGRLACRGEVWLDTAAGVRRRAEARGIGYVPQDHLLFPHRTVAGNLAFGAGRARRAGQDVEAVRREVVEVLELGPLLGRAIDSLSGGERQRVALGRALCSGPRLLMLDEPLAALDLALRHRILPFLVRVREHFDLPILVVSHNPAELLALCDEVLALRAGRVIAQGAPTQVLARPEVYAAAAREGFENMLPGVVAEHGPHATRVRLGPGPEGPLVTVPRAEAAVGRAVALGVPARDILLATARVGGLSARNFLPARVVGLAQAGHCVVVTTQLDGLPVPEVVVELTETAVEELTLAPGAPVWLVVKSSAVAVYA